MLFDHRDRDVEAVGRAERGRAQHREPQRIEDVGAEPAVADRQRADRVAVVRAAEREEGRARRAEVGPVLPRDLQRLLDRGRAVGRVEEVRVLDRDDARERFGQLDDGAVAVAEHRRVRAEVELTADRVVELGNAVTERRHPERGDRVEVAAAVDVDQLVALGAFDDDRMVVGVGRHLREPVPHDGGVPLHPGLVRHAVNLLFAAFRPRRSRFELRTCTA